MDACGVCNGPGAIYECGCNDIPAGDGRATLGLLAAEQHSDQLGGFAPKRNRPYRLHRHLLQWRPGPEYIRYDEDLVRITRHFFEENKPVASVCHGVEIPAFADCVRDRRMATVPKCRFDLEVCGGVFVDEPCVVDGNLISGRTYHDSGHFVGKWIALLEEARAAASG